SYTCSGGASAGCFSGIGRLYGTVSPRGNVTGATPSSFTTSYAYDALGQRTSQSDPNGDTTTYAYDRAGNQTGQTDAAKNTTSYAYNADDQLTQITQPDATTIKYGYDGDGHRASQTNGDGKTTTYAYDPLDRLTSVTDPLGRTTSYTYDGSGNQLTSTDPQGRVTTYGYDHANRLASIGYSDGATHGVTFGYDGDGQRTSMIDATGTSSSSYDSLGRMTQDTTGDGQQVSYGYDLADNQTSITYPNAKTVTQAFNADEQLKSVTDWLSNTTSFAYDPDANLQSTTFPSATSDLDTYGYDHADALTSIQMTQGSSTLAQLSYTRDPNGLITSEAQTGLPGPASSSYSYTTLHQLASAGSQAYSYDDAESITQLDGISGYSYDAASQLTSSPSTTYSYDSLGQRTSQTTTAGTTTYSYDQAGDLTAYTPPTGGASSYTYTGDGLRAKETTGSNTLDFAWNQTSSLPLLLSDGQTSYIYGPNDDPVEQISSNGTPSYLHHDSIGSTRLITDQTGAIAAAFTYSPYGSLAASTGSATSPFGYAGQYTDPESGLLYMRARYYDPTAGQFVTPDPLEPITQKPYAYAADDPIDASDPQGLCGSLSSWGNFWANCGTDAVNAPSSAWNATGGQVGHYLGSHTVGVCLNASGSVGVYGSASGCVALVGGKPVATGTVGFGAASPGASATVGFLSSNATKARELAGWFGVAGVSVNAGVSAGDETSVGRSPCGLIVENQSTVGVGVGLPVPVQPHGGASYTWTSGL
ncbi:MAG: RHS repeat-associated core domain-containing protein, partial [Solirubrobacteraceae bacterium]